MTKLLPFDLQNPEEMKLFDSMFSAYLKEVCDGDEYEEEINDLHDEDLNRQMIEQTMQKHDPYFIMKIFSDNVCVGFISYFYRENRRLGFINNFYVSTEYRNKGIGSAAYAAAEKRLKTLGATSIELNPVNNSLNFYVRNGFTQMRIASNGETIYGKTIL